MSNTKDDSPLIIIRPEKPDDVAAIRIVNERAFGRPAEAELVEALRAHGKATLSLVAEQNAQVVGHILFSPVTIESENQLIAGIGLAPLTVLPEWQNRSIGSQLVEAGLAECRSAGHERAVVLGHARYYPRFGFVPASRYGLRSEYDVPDDVFMAIELRDGALQGCVGLVRYAPEFEAV
jgi:putative acetyltransferase